MALDQAANFVREDVTSAISAGDATINVTDASDFPVPPEGYNIVVWDAGSFARPDQDSNVEIMRVTDVDTTNDVLTVARGQEGTSDVQHPDTSVVVVAQTAKMIADIASEKISNPVTENIDANGNDVTHVGALDAEDLDSTRIARSSGWGEPQTPHWMPVMEDFERGTLTYYDTADEVQISSNTTLQGANSLEVNPNSVTFKLFSPFQIERGWSYRFYYYVGGSADTSRFYPGFGQERNIRTFDQSGYDFPIRYDDDDIRIREHTDGASATLAQATSVGLPIDEWIYLQVDLGFEEIVARAVGIDGTEYASVTASDTTHTGGYWVQWGQNDNAGENYIGYVTRRPL